MSEFDKEKEREKLREKYEREEQQRQATEQMSELLLKGATMTNRHCEECGDPIFRYDGQEFCPTCQATAGGEGEGGDQAGQHQADAQDEGSGAAAEGAGRAGTPEDAGRAETTDASGAAAGETGAAGARSSGAGPADAAGGAGTAAGEPPARERVPPQGAPERGGSTPRNEGDTDGDTAAAAASLRRTLEYFARRAEATDDPGAAREHLRAAREAAETLAALRR